MSRHRRGPIASREPSRDSSPGVLGFVEQLGNRLPDPATLFLIGTLGVMAASQLAVLRGWAVEKTVLDAGRPTSVRVVAESLLSSDGVHWLVSNLVANFRDFPPLAIVLVGMLGIGLAERSGFLPVLLRASLARVPARWLTPLVIFAGVNSSLAVDAGYVVLPPIAAALFLAAGRSPIVGLAAAFAGVAGGFCANLVPTGLDPLLAGLTESGAMLVDASYRVAPTCNWWLMIASTFWITAIGWAVTERIVEPRLLRMGITGTASQTGTDAPAALSADERRGLTAGIATLAATAGLIAIAIAVPGAPLHGSTGATPRWVASIVPLMFFALALPGLAHGIAARTIRSDRDAARMLAETMAALAPYLVLAFFAAQFVACFGYSRLGEMLAVAGGDWLARIALPTPLLLVLFVLSVSVVNLIMASSSAKYAFLAPVFVPMFMQVDVSPELTQAAYRIGDSITNAVAPLNPYQVILLVLLQRYAPGAGIGTLVALMIPYALAFAVAWPLLLAAWVLLGLPLGPAGPLAYGAGAG
jgi:aminobenzoyl-glutamate transport protein